MMQRAVRLKFWAGHEGVLVRAVPAIVRGPLALHQVLGDNFQPTATWRITHIPTGRALLTFRRLDVARWALRWLARRLAWLSRVHSIRDMAGWRPSQLRRALGFVLRLEDRRCMEAIMPEAWFLSQPAFTPLPRLDRRVLS